MNPPKNFRGIVLFFMGLSGLFLACAIVLSARQTESRRTIASLQKTVLSLNEALNTHQAAIARTDFYRFQENVYRLHAPDFTRIAGSVFSLSRKHGFNPYLVMAIIFVESRFDRRAVSGKGACGLMQVNVPVWKDALNIDRRKIFQIDYNIELGLTILKGYLMETRGDIIRALILYNNGYNYTGNDFHEKVLASRFYRHADIG
ncbi:MAG: transglycosylase SLT domain-containing protein [Acidobacteria bacterium]|jgi:soluble lytic murein transglycosylase-like protein|nr:transglycosylase SLT domain-containing protein [Acidobacteriota bacterium]